MTLTTGIERLRIRNFRVLRDVELAGLTPVTALLGPNGSGKSTVFDALDFLSESLRAGLRSAWNQRGGAADIVTHGSTGPVEIEVTCRIEGAVAEYRLAIEHDDDEPVVAEENLSWQPAGAEAPSEALDLRRGAGTVAGIGAIGGQLSLATPDLLGVAVVSQLANTAEVGKFYRFITEIRLSDLALDAMRNGAKDDKTSRLKPDGRNVGAIVRRMRNGLPREWENIRASLQRYVPGFEDIEPFEHGNGAWIVRLREQGREDLIAPENISDGTLQLLGYLVALQTDTSVLLVEEPEKQVHPRLHYRLAEDARRTETAGQVLVATHAPEFVDPLRPDEVWMLFRDESGFAQARRAADIPQLMAMVDSGGLLGNLWTEGFFGLGDPLDRPGQPR
ncbi:ATPase [Amycolatopsis mediterranei S699]|uniref:ATPase n=2 Tax=Amycolatopsis mediterranei TaxID=33910 RepID=A0A0H3D1M4_AMYMU|nr:AAA family ATPase [Amycolatopsis mediterranei]ADJ44545.1 ATPase [Amycolatopsis mediterranei U32]AEK41284.1 ATPase [Amycolatopsis mediterranei S699]AFO76258.1 ATPase [Amycolatopsis mediterranei S699]AGT83387.1 ATPase [Amycolatopsis mediterranei RB]KDO07097.1 ATPase [Amycolatopsis mediterranei]